MHLNVSVTSRDLQTSHLVLAGEANVSVSSWSREANVSVSAIDVSCPSLLKSVSRACCGKHRRTLCSCRRAL